MSAQSLFLCGSLASLGLLYFYPELAEKVQERKHNQQSKKDAHNHNDHDGHHHRNASRNHKAPHDEDEVMLVNVNCRGGDAGNNNGCETQKQLSGSSTPSSVHETSPLQQQQQGPQARRRVKICVDKNEAYSPWHTPGGTLLKSQAVIDREKEQNPTTRMLHLPYRQFDEDDDEDEDEEEVGDHDNTSIEKAKDSNANGTTCLEQQKKEEHEALLAPDAHADDRSTSASVSPSHDVNVSSPNEQQQPIKLVSALKGKRKRKNQKKGKEDSNKAGDTSGTVNEVKNKTSGKSVVNKVDDGDDERTESSPSNGTDHHNGKNSNNLATALREAIIAGVSCEKLCAILGDIITASEEEKEEATVDGDVTPGDMNNGNALNLDAKEKKGEVNCNETKVRRRKNVKRIVENIPIDVLHLCAQHLQRGQEPFLRALWDVLVRLDKLRSQIFLHQAEQQQHQKQTKKIDVDIPDFLGAVVNNMTPSMLVCAVGKSHIATEMLQLAANTFKCSSSSSPQQTSPFSLPASGSSRNGGGGAVFHRSTTPPPTSSSSPSSPCPRQLLNETNNALWAPMHIAASIQGRAHLLQELLRLGADVNCLNDHGSSPLHLAVSAKNIDAVKTIMLHFGMWEAVAPSTNTISPPSGVGAAGGGGNGGGPCQQLPPGTPLHAPQQCVNVHPGADANGNTLLHLCAAAGFDYLPLVKIILDEHPTLTLATNHHRQTPLHCSLMHSHGRVSALLIHRDAMCSPCARPPTVSSEKEAGEHDEEPVTPKKNKFLLQSVVAQDDHGVTPLHISSAADDVGMLRTMLMACQNQASKCQVKLEDHIKDEALEKEEEGVAVKNGGKDYDDVDDDKNGSEIPTSYCEKPIRKMLLGDFITLETTDASGFTPLHIAAMKGSRRAVEFLLQHGANVNAVLTMTTTNNNNKDEQHGGGVNVDTPFAMALKHEEKEIASMILYSEAFDLRANVFIEGDDKKEQEDQQQRPLLALSCRAGKPFSTISEYLLEKFTSMSSNKDDEEKSDNNSTTSTTVLQDQLLKPLKCLGGKVSNSENEGGGNNNDDADCPQKLDCFTAVHYAAASGDTQLLTVIAEAASQCPSTSPCGVRGFNGGSIFLLDKPNDDSCDGYATTFTTTPLYLAAAEAMAPDAVQLIITDVLERCCNGGGEDHDATKNATSSKPKRNLMWLLTTRDTKHHYTPLHAVCQEYNRRLDAGFDPDTSNECKALLRCADILSQHLFGGVVGDDDNDNEMNDAILRECVEMAAAATSEATGKDPSVVEQDQCSGDGSKEERSMFLKLLCEYDKKK